VVCRVRKRRAEVAERDDGHVAVVEVEVHPVMVLKQVNRRAEAAVGVLVPAMRAEVHARQQAGSQPWLTPTRLFLVPRTRNLFS